MIWVGVIPLQVQLSVEDGQLTLLAQCFDDRESAVFKKTMIRKLDLPKYVDHKMLHCDLSKEGVLTIEMPFHLPPQRRPQGPSVVPIVNEVDGTRKIRLAFMIGPDFTADDVKIEKNGQHLVVTASYDAEIGVYGFQVTSVVVIEIQVFRNTYLKCIYCIFCILLHWQK